MEVWRDVRGYEGLYQVSTFGRVRSLDRTIHGVRYGQAWSSTRKGREMCPNTDKDGYKTIKLCSEGRVSRWRVHRLVALAFIPNPEDKPQINHINGHKADNRVENLEWATNSENTLHKFKVLKCRASRVKETVCLDTMKVYPTATAAARECGVDISHVVACCRGRRSHAGGYRFQYKE